MEKVREISKILIEHLRKLQFVRAYKELFSDDAESIDPINTQNGLIKGLNLLIDLETQFLSKSIIHQIEISEAIHAGAYFSIQLSMHFSISGQQNKLDEICVYQVRKGKIISQQFFIS